jgi:hypothetical protein
MEQFTQEQSDHRKIRFTYLNPIKTAMNMEQMGSAIIQLK